MTATRTRARRGAPIRSTRGALTRAQLRELEAELRAERARLERSLGGDSEVEIVSPLGRDDVIHDGHVHARSAAIDDALQRLADGTYGNCDRCGQPIPFGRLLVMPESQRCMACGPHA